MGVQRVDGCESLWVRLEHALEAEPRELSGLKCGGGVGGVGGALEDLSRRVALLDPAARRTPPPSATRASLGLPSRTWTQAPSLRAPSLAHAPAFSYPHFPTRPHPRSPPYPRARDTDTPGSRPRLYPPRPAHLHAAHTPASRLAFPRDPPHTRAGWGRACRTLFEPRCRISAHASMRDRCFSHGVEQDR